MILDCVVLDGSTRHRALLVAAHITKFEAAENDTTRVCLVNNDTVLVNTSLEDFTCDYLRVLRTTPRQVGQRKHDA